MDDRTKRRLLEKNEKLINMVIERAKRDFPDDIALIGLTGSFEHGDFHEKSDLDLIIVNNTDAGWGIANCFIFDGVGYDIYCTPWENLEAKSRLENTGVSSLTELKMLYCAKPEYMDRFNGLKQRALASLAEPVGKNCIERAKKHIDLAKQDYTDTLLSDDAGAVRYAAGGVLYNLVNALVNLNNTCIRQGLKRYFEEIRSYKYLPENFMELYTAVIDAKTVPQMREAALSMLKSVVTLCEAMWSDLVVRPSPSYDNLRGTYEELWSNHRNKVKCCAAFNDKSFAFLEAVFAQNYLDEMTKDRGTRKFDLMCHFDPDDLGAFRDAFLRAMDDYLAEYAKVGREVEMYETFEELYEAFMKQD